MFNAWLDDPEIHELDEQTLKSLAIARMDADELLSVDEHADIRRLEREIRRIQSGAGPDGVDSTVELDVAWCRILLSALEADGFDGGGVA